MSEYQHYEWQTVDRPLTEAEQEAVRKLSSHIDVSSSRAIVTYAWGDFKHDARQVLIRFFDAHLYLANWGSRRLMFRFPSGILNREAIAPYCVSDQITFGTINGYDFLDMDLSEGEGEGGNWIECGSELSGLLSLRNSLIQGDYRVLYLAWLKVMSVRNGSWRHKGKSLEVKLPVTAGLKQLSPALKSFVEKVEVWTCLVEAAAECSPAGAEFVEIKFPPLVAKLSREECDEFLCRIAQGDPAAGMSLKKRLLSMMPNSWMLSEVCCSYDELWQRAEVINKAHKKRQERENRRNHEAEMKALADHEEETWQQVGSLVSLKNSKNYDEAVRLLGKLAQLSEFRGMQFDYGQRVKDLCEQYKRLSGFQLRVKQAKLIH